MSRALLALACLAAAPTPAWACASCACGDPTLTTMGLEKPFAGRVRLSTEVAYRYEQTAAPDGGAWLTDDLRLSLGVAWSVTDRIVLSATLPAVTTSQRAPNLASLRGFGLGDAELRARFVVVRDGPGARHLGGLLASLELPTGTPLREGESLRDVDLQPGTGAWTPGFGLWYGAFLGPWSTFVSATLRGSTPGFDQRRPGVTGLMSVVAQWQPHPVVGVRLSADARGMTPEQVADVPDPLTGGWLLQATPGLLVNVHEDVLLSVVVGLPVWQTTPDGSREGVAPRLGVVVDL